MVSIVWVYPSLLTCRVPLLKIAFKFLCRLVFKFMWMSSEDCACWVHDKAVFTVGGSHRTGFQRGCILYSNTYPEPAARRLPRASNPLQHFLSFWILAILSIPRGITVAVIDSSSMGCEIKYLSTVVCIFSGRMSAHLFTHFLSRAAVHFLLLCCKSSWNILDESFSRYSNVFCKHFPPACGSSSHPLAVCFTEQKC